MKRVDFLDTDGIRRRVFLPEGSSNVDEGIPISVRFDEAYSHMPLEFLRLLVNELWNRDLVEPIDFQNRNAPELIRSALLSVVKKDTMDILAVAKEQSNARR